MMQTVPKKPSADELHRQVKELRDEVKLLRDTVNNLMMIIIEKELEKFEDEEEAMPMPEELTYGKYKLQQFN